MYNPRRQQNNDLVEKLKKEGMAYLQKSKAEKLKPVPETPPVKLEVAPKAVEQAVKPPPKKRYSTYQKSIWSKFE